MAGRVGAKLGITTSFDALSLLASTSVLLAAYLWREQDEVELPHRHNDLPNDHPH